MICWYIDDVIYDGDYDKFERLALFSSYFACYILDVEADICGSPLVFYPTYPTPLMVYHYMLIYRKAFDFLEAFLEYE